MASSQIQSLQKDKQLLSISSLVNEVAVIAFLSESISRAMIGIKNSFIE